MPKASSEGRPLTQAQKRFYASDVCEEARRLLQILADDSAYSTEPPPLTGNYTPFVERHLYHLSTHPQTNVNGYISNLKLMTSIKRSRPAS